MVMIGDLLREVPPITRFICGSSIVMQFLVYIQVLSKFDLHFSLSFIFSKFQIWRVFTNLLYFGDLNIYTFFCMLMLYLLILISSLKPKNSYRCSKRLEEHTFRNRAADYLFFLLFGIFVMTIYASFAGFPSLSRSFMTMILYLWSRYNKNVILLVFGLVPMKAPYITWSFIVIDLMIGESVAHDILGIVVAHSFYFFHEIYPKLPFSQEVRILKPPKFFEKMVGLMNIKPIEQVYLDD